MAPRSVDDSKWSRSKTVGKGLMTMAAFSCLGYFILAEEDPRPVGPPCVVVEEIPNSFQAKCLSPYWDAEDDCTQEGCVRKNQTCTTPSRWWDNEFYPLYLTLADTTYGNTYIDDTGKVCQHKVQCLTGALDAMKNCDSGTLFPNMEYPDVHEGPHGECWTPNQFDPNPPTGCKLCSVGTVLPGGDWTATRKKQILCPFKPPPPEDP